MSNDLKKPQLRTLRYWLVDGVPELFVGFILFMAAIVYYFQESVPGSLLSKILGIVSVFLVCGGGFGGRWIIQRIKEHTTYPRTGYLAYKSAWKNKREVMIASGLTALFIIFNVLILVTNTNTEHLGLVISGVLLGVLVIQAGYQSGLHRFYVLAFLDFLTGAVLLVSGITVVLGLSLFFGLNGLIILISGSLVLWKYMRANSAPQDTPSEL
ncbi:MAG: hypothetical protein ABSG01_06835 [Anaerolineales bacterium]